jgi:hypothetical protein
MFPAAAFLLSRPLISFAKWVVLEILRTDELDLNPWIGLGVIIPYPGWLFFGSFGILGILFCDRWFREEGSTGRFVLRHLLFWSGVVSLFTSSADVELAAMFTLVGALWDKVSLPFTLTPMLLSHYAPLILCSSHTMLLSHYAPPPLLPQLWWMYMCVWDLFVFVCWRIYIWYYSSRPGQYNARPLMSMEEYEMEGRNETQHHLAILQQYLQQNSKEMDKLQVGGKQSVSDFTNGMTDHLGKRPGEEDDEDGTSTSWFGRIASIWRGFMRCMRSFGMTIGIAVVGAV